MNPILPRGLVVSCQADDGTPTDFPEMIVAFAQSAARGGAQALRLNSAAHVRAVKAAVSLPVIAIQKYYPPDGAQVLITGDAAAVPDLIAAGADVIAFDATPRPRPSSLQDIIRAIHDGGAQAMADIRRFEDAAQAVALGVDYLATTLSVFDLPAYTPNITLIEQLCAAYPAVPVVAEGNFWTPQDVRRALDAGAHAVVVGSAITRPWLITEWFAHATR